MLGSRKKVQEVGAEGSKEKSSGHQVQGQDCLAVLKNRTSTIKVPAGMGRYGKKQGQRRDSEGVSKSQ